MDKIAQHEESGLPGGAPLLGAHPQDMDDGEVNRVVARHQREQGARCVYARSGVVRAARKTSDGWHLDRTG